MNGASFSGKVYLRASRFATMPEDTVKGRFGSGSQWFCVHGLPNTAMKRIRIVALVFVGVATQVSVTLASPARFWLSSSNVATSGPEAPIVAGVQGATRQLYIWAQPATINAALPYNVSTNRFRTLLNFSLDVVASDPILDFVDG